MGMVPTGEYDLIIRVRWRCDLMSNYFDHSLLLLPVLMSPILGAVHVRSWMSVTSLSDVMAVRVALTMLGKAAVTYSYTLIYLYTPEMYPTAIRGAGLGIGTMMSRIGGIVAPIVADIVSRFSLFTGL